MNLSKWFQGLRARLLLLSLIPLMALLVVAFEGYQGAHTLGADLDHAVREELPKSTYRGEMDASVHTMVMSLLQTYATAENIEERNKSIKRAESEIERYKTNSEQYAKYDLNEAEKKHFAPIHENWPKAEKAAFEVLALLKKHTPSENEKANEIIHGELMHYVHPIDEAFEKLDELQKEELVFTQEQSEKTEQRVYQMIFLFSALGFAISLAFSILLAIRLVKTLDTVSKNLMEGAAQVHSASSQIASASEELSQSTTEQAASLEETAASLEEISSMIAKAADGANATASRSIESQKKAEEGKEATTQMLNSIEEISQSNEAIMDQTNKSNQQMTEIVKVIQDIGQKTKVINDIVFQTKLLSFNASVEAARAGEHGKGFAVVAEEVGNLAQMSGNAAKEITEMLDSSVKKVESIVEETKRSVESLVTQGKQKVEVGVETAKKCAGVLDEIVSNVSAVSGLSQEISNASKEQAQGVSEINKAMNQLDAVTQQNSATSEEAASSAEELSAQAESLKDAVAELVRTIDGGASNANGRAHDKGNSNNLHQPKSNVVPLKKNPSVDKVAPLKKASGDGIIPDSNHSGFQDV